MAALNVDLAGLVDQIRDEVLTQLRSELEQLPETMSATDAARWLGISRTTLAKWVDNGLPFIEVDDGGKRFCPHELREWKRSKMRRHGREAA